VGCPVSFFRRVPVVWTRLTGDRMDYLTNVLGLDKKEAAALLAR
jgi:hypothetical protein